MIDLLLPRTDAGVAAQAIVVAVVTAALLAAVWRHREIRVLVVGLAVFAYGVMGVRALH